MFANLDSNRRKCFVVHELYASSETVVYYNLLKNVVL